tara:strand:- start:1503 stop:1784 length:282 start_codon:yes stop_codon:yes gene_type:complete
MSRSKDLEEDIKIAGDLEHVAATKGGVLLIKGLVTDIVGAIDTLAVKYATLSHPEFIALGAEIKTKIDLLRSLTRAKKTKEALVEMLEEALSE